MSWEDIQDEDWGRIGRRLMNMWTEFKSFKSVINLKKYREEIEAIEKAIEENVEKRKGFLEAFKEELKSEEKRRSIRATEIEAIIEKGRKGDHFERLSKIKGYKTAEDMEECLRKTLQKRDVLVFFTKEDVDQAVEEGKILHEYSDDLKEIINRPDIAIFDITALRARRTRLALPDITSQELGIPIHQLIHC